MKLILALITLTLSIATFADVKVTFDHDAEFYRAQVIQTTPIAETNALHDFFEALNLDEEYRETEVVKQFTSKDQNFFFMCERISHADYAMVATCSFRMKKNQTQDASVMGIKGYEVWTLNKEIAKEVSTVLPTTGRPVLINLSRKFSVAAFSDIIAFNFNL